MTHEQFEAALRAFKREHGSYPETIAFDPPVFAASWEEQLAGAERVLLYGAADR
jgi:hypothetical protein